MRERDKRRRGSEIDERKSDVLLKKVQERDRQIQMGIVCLQTQQGLHRGAGYSVRGKDSRKWRRRTDSEQRGKGAQEYRDEGVIKQRCGS